MLSCMSTTQLLHHCGAPRHTCKLTHGCRAYDGPLGEPKVSLKNTTELLPYLKVSTASFTMGLRAEACG